MNKNDLEHNLMLAEKRLLELGERIITLTNENEILRRKNEELENDIETLNEQFSKRLKALSDELYQYIGNQNQQLNAYIDLSKKECDNRISFLSDELYQYNEKQNHELSQEIDNRVSSLSSAIYQHIENQNRQLGEYVNSQKKESDNKVLNASNELYQHIANVNKTRDEDLGNYKKQMNNELWIRTFGLDNMISELQLAIVEKEFPGNRAKLESLRDTHKGEKCFVIGNGPSLTAADLDKLKEKNIFCFASKGIYNIFDKTEWRPDVWAASDLGHIDANEEKINKLDDMIKLLCCQTVIKLGKKINNAIYFPFIQAERRPPFFNADIMRGVHFWGTVTCKLINFAVYMGFKEIYLLGTDNQYGMKKGKDGKYVYDINAKNHFSDDYLAEKEKKECEETINDMVRSMEYVNLSFQAVKWHCDEMGIKIFNATHGGVLETFPRIDFDELVK